MHEISPNWNFLVLNVILSSFSWFGQQMQILSPHILPSFGRIFYNSASLSPNWDFIQFSRFWERMQILPLESFPKLQPVFEMQGLFLLDVDKFQPFFVFFTKMQRLPLLIQQNLGRFRQQTNHKRIILCDFTHSQPIFDKIASLTP